MTPPRPNNAPMIRVFAIPVKWVCGCGHTNLLRETPCRMQHIPCECEKCNAIGYADAGHEC